MTETDDFDGRVGQNVRKLRVALGMNQEQLAARVEGRGFPFRQQTIAKIESGQRPLRLQEAIELVSALSLDLEVLLEGPDVTDQIKRMQHLAVLREDAQRLETQVVRLTQQLDAARTSLERVYRNIALAENSYKEFDHDLGEVRRVEVASPMRITETSQEAADATAAKLDAEGLGPYEITVVPEEDAETKRAKELEELKRNPSWVAGMARESLAGEKAKSPKRSRSLAEGKAQESPAGEKAES